MLNSVIALRACCVRAVRRRIDHEQHQQADTSMQEFTTQRAAHPPTSALSVSPAASCHLVRMLANGLALARGAAHDYVESAEHSPSAAECSACSASATMSLRLFFQRRAARDLFFEVARVFRARLVACSALIGRVLTNGYFSGCSMDSTARSTSNSGQYR